MKKFLFVVSMFVILLTMGTVVLASADSPCLGTLEEVEAFTLPYAEPMREELLPYSLVANVIVKISSPCDTAFRQQYPSNYAYQTDRALELADDYLASEFGIDYRSVAQPVWNYSASNTTSPRTILNAAINSHGLTYNGTQTADLMVAFSGINPETVIDGETYIYYGMADDIPADCAIIFDYGLSANAYNVQHETGHLYGLHHHDDDVLPFPTNPVCVMNSGILTTNYNNLCTPHYEQWEDNYNDHS